ncbi:hypothetical protein OO012_08600 [Rhodobacteraceae bacterium KMM 6894]|nr:hypothetical protein [Rhodobacteraceae bacterium KMM 6894]
MIDPAWFQTELERASQKLGEKLGVRGRSFAIRLRRAGRALPAHAQKAGRVLIEAQALIDNPRLRRRIDEGQMRAAFRSLHAGLDPIDPKERRKGALLGLAGSMVFNLMLVVAAVIAVLRWRGLI